MTDPIRIPVLPREDNYGDCSYDYVRIDPTLARRIVELGGGSSLEQRIDTIVDGQTDLNVGYDQRIAKLEALIAKHQHTMQTEHGERYTGEPRMYGTKIDGNHYDKFGYDAHGHKLRTTNPDGSLKPVALRLAADGSVVDADAGDEAAVEALRKTKTGGNIFVADSVGDYIVGEKVARIILAAIKAGKVPGVQHMPTMSAYVIRLQEDVAAKDKAHHDARERFKSEMQRLRADLAAQRDELAALLRQVLRDFDEDDEGRITVQLVDDVKCSLARLTPTAPTNGEGDAK